jgi:acyl-CoA thioester hydrolase
MHVGSETGQRFSLSVIRRTGFQPVLLRAKGAFDMLSGEIQIRVRYAETDRMGLLHHANYLVYFEQARTELLRSHGAAYKELEDQGFFLVIAKVEVKYKSPAHYDDVLAIRTTVTRSSPIRIEHKYEVFREGTLICEGATTLACVDREGKLQAMPQWLIEAK